MKRLVLIFTIIIVLASCSLEMHDSDGFRIYEFGWHIPEDHALVQSHDEFMLGLESCTEKYINKLPATISNKQNIAIDVRITESSCQYWVTIAPHALYIVGDTL